MKIDLWRSLVQPPQEVRTSHCCRGYDDCCRHVFHLIRVLLLLTATGSRTGPNHAGPPAAEGMAAVLAAVAVLMMAAVLAAVALGQPQTPGAASPLTLDQCRTNGGSSWSLISVNWF